MYLTCSLSDIIVNHSLHWTFGEHIPRFCHPEWLQTYTTSILYIVKFSYPNYTQFEKGTNHCPPEQGGSLSTTFAQFAVSIFYVRFFYSPTGLLFFSILCLSGSLWILGASPPISTGDILAGNCREHEPLQWSLCHSPASPGKATQRPDIYYTVQSSSSPLVAAVDHSRKSTATERRRLATLPRIVCRLLTFCICHTINTNV